MARWLRLNSAALLLALFSTAAAPVSFADTPAHKIPARRPPANSSTPQSPEIVVTASRQNLTGKVATASQGSVTAEELALRPTYRVGQLLESVPGLMVTVHSGEGKAPQYLARGFNLDHGTDIANFVDDLPVNRPTNAHGQGYSDLNFVLPQLLAGLDYSKGTYDPAVGDFGDVAAEHMRLANDIPNQISISAGTLGDEEVFLGGVRRTGANSRVLAAVDLGHVDGPFNPPNEFRKTAAEFRFSQGEPANGGDLTVMYYKGDGRLSTDQPVRAVSEHLIGRYGVLDPSDGNSSERLSLSSHLAWDHQSWSVSSNVYFVHSRQTLWNNFTHYLEDPVAGDQEQQDETRDLIGGAAAFRLHSTIGGVATHTTVGVQGRYDDIYVDRRHTRDRAVLDYCELLNPDGVTAIKVDVGQPACSADRARVGDMGVYFENSTPWTRWLRTEIGAREEFYSGYDRGLLPGAPYSKSAFTDSARLFQPKASIVLGPWRSTELYFSANRGFHSDDIRGVSGAVPLEGLGGSRAAPLLVKADGAEVGVRSNVIPGVQIQASLFNIRLNSEIIYDQDQGEDQPGPPSDRYGVEVSAQYRPASWIEINMDLSFDHARFVGTSATNLLHDFGQPGSFIPLAPTFIGSLGVRVNNLGPWYGGVQLRSLGPYALVSDNSQRDNGYTEVNLDAGYKFSGRLRAQLSIFNAFNVRADAGAFYYTTNIHDGLGPTADRQIHPLEPTSARAGLTLAF